MSNLEIADSAPQLNESNLQAFEAEFNIVLPDEYRQFLLQHNGGKPNLRGFNYRNMSFGPNRSSVQRFIPIDPNDRFDIVRLMRYKEPVIPSMPKTMIPFASDPSGNVLCISAFGDDIGRVYLWEHDMSEGNQFGFVASSFNEFLDALYERDISASPDRSVWGFMRRFLGR